MAAVNPQLLARLLISLLGHVVANGLGAVGLRQLAVLALIQAQLRQGH